LNFPGSSAQDHAVLVLLLNLVGFFISVWRKCFEQPVPEKMRLEMLIAMQIEILNSRMVNRILSIGQNRDTQISRYLAVLTRIEILVEFEFLCIFLRYKFKSRFWFNLNLQLTKISPLFRISICIPTSISSLIFLERCTTEVPAPYTTHQPLQTYQMLQTPLHPTHLPCP